MADAIDELVAELRANTAELKARRKVDTDLLEEVRRLREEFARLGAAGPPPAPAPPRAPVDATAEVVSNLAESLVRKIAERYQGKKGKG